MMIHLRLIEILTAVAQGESLSEFTIKSFQHSKAIDLGVSIGLISTVSHEEHGEPHWEYSVTPNGYKLINVLIHGIIEAEQEIVHNKVPIKDYYDEFEA